MLLNEKAAIGAAIARNAINLDYMNLTIKNIQK